MIWQQSTFIHSVVCLYTVPYPLPQRVLHKVQASGPPFIFQYPVLSLKSSSSCLRLLLRLPILVSFLLSVLQQSVLEDSSYARFDQSSQSRQQYKETEGKFRLLPESTITKEKKKTTRILEGHMRNGRHLNLSAPKCVSSAFCCAKINPLNPELNPICYLLALLGAHHFLHVSRVRVKLLTFR